MNKGYYQIVFIGIAYACLSLIYEYIYESNLRPKNITGIVSGRFVHITIVMYMCLYFYCFYSCKNHLHHYVYLGIILLIIFSWTIFNACLLAQYEWSFYHGDVYKRKNDKTRHMNMIGHQYLGAIMGVSIFGTLFVLKTNIIYKIAYLILFFCLLKANPSGTYFRPITLNQSLINIRENYGKILHFE
jgi:hypothetical protein